MTSSANEMRPGSNEPVLEDKRNDDGSCRADDRERQLLACELHDGLLQQIVGAKMMLEAAVARVSSGQSLLPGELTTVCEHLDAAMVEGRRLIGGLRPSVVSEHGIVAALERLLRELSPLRSVTIHFRHDVKQASYSPSLDHTLFRIAQESVANIVRHSHASDAEIELNEEADRVRLMIRDNGIGFEMTEVPQARFGIWGIRERARMAGGKASIESAPGRGTTVIADLPKEVQPM